LLVEAYELPNGAAGALFEQTATINLPVIASLNRVTMIGALFDIIAALGALSDRQ